MNSIPHPKTQRTSPFNYSTMPPNPDELLPFLGVHQHQHRPQPYQMCAQGSSRGFIPDGSTYQTRFYCGDIMNCPRCRKFWVKSWLQRGVEADYLVELSLTALQPKQLEKLKASIGGEYALVCDWERDKGFLFWRGGNYAIEEDVWVNLPLGKVRRLTDTAQFFAFLTGALHRASRERPRQRVLRVSHHFFQPMATKTPKRGPVYWTYDPKSPQELAQESAQRGFKVFKMGRESYMCLPPDDLMASCPCGFNPITPQEAARHRLYCPHARLRKP